MSQASLLELMARCSKVVPQRRHGATMKIGGFMDRSLSVRRSRTVLQVLKYFPPNTTAKTESWIRRPGGFMHGDNVNDVDAVFGALGAHQFMRS